MRKRMKAEKSASLEVKTLRLRKVETLLEIVDPRDSNGYGPKAAVEQSFLSSDTQRETCRQLAAMMR